MITSARRIMGSAIGILLLLGAVAPAFSQTYTPSPSSWTMDIVQGQQGMTTEAGPTMGGLPSVSCNGTKVSFDLGSNWSIYRGGGSAYFQYESDLMPDWTTIATQSDSESGGPWPPISYPNNPVSCSNLSSLKFRLYLRAAAGPDGSVLGGATVETVSVTNN